MTTTHVRMKVKGNLKKIMQFNRLLKHLDHDWPYPEETMHCVVCKGVVYKNPVFTPGEIKAAAAQVGVKVRLKRYMLGSKCGAGR